jgi:hypothetical protein
MLPLRWDRPFRARLVVTGDQLARATTEQLCRRATGADAIAQLLHLAARRFFAERRLVEVWPSIDVALPLRCGATTRARATGSTLWRRPAGRVALRLPKALD